MREVKYRYRVKAGKLERQEVVWKAEVLLGG
jgi:hypothetical protein